METFDVDLHGQEELMGTDPGPEETVLEQMEREELLGKMNEWLSSLPTRKAQVIRYRFGLDGGQPHTLEETATEFGTTRERVHQLEESTIGTRIHNRVHAALDANWRLWDYMED